MRRLTVFCAAVFACAFIATASTATQTDEETADEPAALQPNHTYVLCINGYSGHPSNKLLLKIGELWRPTGEGYVDYASVRADGDGKIAPSIHKSLPKGDYKVKLLVKDPAQDWEVVWNKDEIEFSVK